MCSNRNENRAAAGNEIWRAVLDRKIDIGQGNRDRRAVRSGNGLFMQSSVETEVISVEQNTERRSISIFASL